MRRPQEKPDSQPPSFWLPAVAALVSTWAPSLRTCGYTFVLSLAALLLASLAQAPIALSLLSTDVNSLARRTGLFEWVQVSSFLVQM